VEAYLEEDGDLPEAAAGGAEEEGADLVDLEDEVLALDVEVAGERGQQRGLRSGSRTGRRQCTGTRAPWRVREGARGAQQPIG